MRTLSTPEMCRLTGLPVYTLKRWAARFLLNPALSQPGPGNYRRFSLVEGFALYAGLAWKRAESGMDRAASLIRFLARVPQERLEANLATGRTLPVLPAMFGPTEVSLVLGADAFVAPAADTPEELLARIDLGRLWREFGDRVAGLAERPTTQAVRKASRRQLV